MTFEYVSSTSITLLVTESTYVFREDNRSRFSLSPDPSISATTPQPLRLSIRSSSRTIRTKMPPHTTTDGSLPSSRHPIDLSSSTGRRFDYQGADCTSENADYTPETPFDQVGALRGSARDQYDRQCPDSTSESANHAPEIPRTRWVLSAVLPGITLIPRALTLPQTYQTIPRRAQV